MCLAVPMKVIDLHGDNMGVAELGGTHYNVELSLIPDVKIGNYVIVHAGYAIEMLDEEEANERLEFFSHMAEAYQADSEE